MKLKSLPPMDALELVNSVNIRKKRSITHKQLQAKLYKEKLSSPIFNHYYLTLNDKNSVGDILFSKESNDFFVSNLESYGRRKYRGIGSKLMQVAVEECMQHNHNGKLYLMAQPLHLFQKSPVNFYTKLGFLPDSSQSIHDINDFGVKMILHPSTINSWTKKVHDTPILNKVI